MSLRVLAPAKVNLCLLMGGTRADGRHELLTLFESISLADELSLEMVDGLPRDLVNCPGVEDPNLVSEALAALRAGGWTAPTVSIEIDKRIPVAAGLAGGSADAAAALRLAASVAPVSPDLIAAVAAALGADVPGQVSPGLSVGRGAGELIEPVAPLATHAFLVLPQPIPLSTAEVYREADRLGLQRSAADLEAQSTALAAVLTPGAVLPAELLVNDLEPAALSLCPPIEEALDSARYAAAEHAMVSGSGPTVVGLFWGEDAFARASAGAAALTGRYPGASAAEPVDASFGAPREA